MYRANYHVDNPSDYWKMSIYIVFLDHLVEEISKRVVSNDERFLASYLNPASLLNIASEIIEMECKENYRSPEGYSSMCKKGI
jgi:hypothetical protein